MIRESITKTLDRIYDFPPGELEEVVGQIMSDLPRTNAKKLTPAEVRGMRASWKRGATQAAIASDFGVNPATVSRTVRGLYW